MAGNKSIFEHWEAYVQNASPLIKDWLEKENDYLKQNIKKNSIILDVGCGFGRNIEAINGICKKIVGIDHNKKLLEGTKKKMKKFGNIEILFGEATNLKFPENYFDYAICMGNTFGNLGENKIKALKEMKRVAKNGGTIIISVYSEKALEERLASYSRAGVEIAKIEGTTVITKEGFEFEQFTKEELTKIFETTGLKPEIKELNQILYICKAKKE
jgi:ubiquinone/menaquinone biosynthesis C-methylase UbiE